MFKDRKALDRRLKQKLAMQRAMTSLIDKEIIADSDEFVLETANWVTMWVDTGHVVSFDGGRTNGYRGIDIQGQLMWLVRHEDKQHGYHSLETDPLAAIEEAEHAWAARKEVRQRWDVVERVARHLIMGRQKFSVTRQDAVASPLCMVGIDSFLRRMRLAQVQRVSGRVAALLMQVEPQVGFVIDVAHRRVSVATRQKDPAKAGCLKDV